jgi:hypothetical protein
MQSTTRPRLLPAALCLLASLAAAPAGAQEFQPYPQPKITAEQYARYADQVLQAFGYSTEILKDQKLIAFSDERSRTFYVFTTKDHPAHPAWITRQMVEEDGQVRVKQIGYFAGNEEAFSRLFREFQGRNKQLMEDVARRNQ